jgi:hypothetical protein
MYLPLTGQKKLAERDRGKNMEIGSVSSGATARPIAAGKSQAAGSGDSPAQTSSSDTESAGQPHEANGAVTSDYQSDFYAPEKMSSEDSMSLRNSDAANMLETVKDIAALQILEKMVEALGKIMKD